MHRLRFASVNVVVVATLVALMAIAWPWSRKPAANGPAPASATAEQEPVCPNDAQADGKVVSRSWGKVEYERQQSLAAPLAAGAALDAEVGNGAIILTGRDQEGCELQATIRIKAGSETRARQLAGWVKIALVGKPEGLHMEMQQPRIALRESIHIEMKLAVPHKTNLRLRADNGNIEVADVAGRVFCGADNGRVSLRNVAGTTDLSAANGTVSAEQLAGDCAARADNGRVTIRFADGAAGACNLRASNGRIICRNVSGQVTAQADNGDVDVAYAPGAPAACRVDLTSQNGRIRLVVPQNVSAAVDARAANGRIRTKLPVTVKGQLSGERIEGTLGGGEGLVRLRASNGTIQLE